MPFRDFTEVAQPDFLAVPINGKTYVIRPVGALDGIKLELQFAPVPEGGEPAPAMTNEELFQITLGPVLAEMRADNVPVEAIARAAMTALADHQEGRAAAEAWWESGGLPERLAAYMAAKIGPSPDSTPSPSTESGNETPSPASTRRTTSPRATQPRKRKPPANAKANRSPGPN
jgi:hypothetical protein